MSEIKSVKFEVEVPVIDGQVPSVIENDSLTLIQLGATEYILAVKDNVPGRYLEAIKHYFQQRIGHGGLLLMQQSGLTAQTLLGQANQKGYLMNLLAEAKQQGQIVAAPKVEGVYVPQIVEDHREGDGGEGYVLMTFTHRVEPCVVCERLIGPVGMDAQNANAGLVAYGGVHPDRYGRKVCADCLAQDKVTFTCWLCHQPRPSSHIQESVGDPPDYLCGDCFETVSAKVWDETRDKLHDAHRWDYS